MIQPPGYAASKKYERYDGGPCVRNTARCGMHFILSGKSGNGQRFDLWHDSVEKGVCEIS